MQFETCKPGMTNRTKMNQAYENSNVLIAGTTHCGLQMRFLDVIVFDGIEM